MNVSEIYKELGALTDDRDRMEAPEIFRVLGKRRPELVRPFAEQLKQISENDGNRVVRIHCLGALKTIAPDREDLQETKNES